MPFVRTCVFATTLSLLSGVTPSWAQNQCTALIQNGLYNTYRTTTGSSSLTVAQSNFCTAYQSYKQNHVAAGLSGSYGILSGNANASIEQIEAVGSALCTASFSQASASANLEKYATIVDPNITAAFTKCVEASNHGLIYNLQPFANNPNVLTISASYIGQGHTQAQHVDSITINQETPLDSLQKVTCDGKLFAEGTKSGGVDLDPNTLSMTCTRSRVSGDASSFAYMGKQVYFGPVRIAVDTNLGSIAADMPEIPVSKPPSPEVLVPIKTIVAFGGTSEPDGWKICDGRSVSRTEYANLFRVIGIAHGSGDGVSTFNLPDYRGRFLRGLSTDADGRDPDRAARTAAQNGGNAGAAVGSIEQDALASHDHPATYDGQLIAQNPAAPVASGFTQGDKYQNTGYGKVTIGKTGGSETRPVNAAVVFLIKVK